MSDDIARKMHAEDQLPRTLLPVEVVAAQLVLDGALHILSEREMSTGAIPTDTEFHHLAIITARSRGYAVPLPTQSDLLHAATGMVHQYLDDHGVEA